MQAEIVAAREVFRANLPDGPQGRGGSSTSPARSTPPATVQDNVLFGRIVDTYAEAGERVNALLRETMDALDLTGPVIELGLAFDIGSGAKRLSLAQQQKLALGARAGEAARPPDRQPGACRARRATPRMRP